VDLRRERQPDLVVHRIHRGVRQVDVPATKPFIKLEGLGSSPSGVLIVDSVPASAGGENPTAVIRGKSFEATNLTFSNDYDEVANGGSQRGGSTPRSSTASRI
jgi:hypothetical protein